jgi:hypothetical protein
MKIVLGSSTASAIPILPEASMPNIAEVRSRAEAAFHWVLGGLERMDLLERVEVELVACGIGNSEKLTWCERLQNELRSKSLASIEVVCVERLIVRTEYMPL